MPLPPPIVQINPADLAQIEKTIQEMQSILQNLRHTVVAFINPINFDFDPNNAPIADGTIVDSIFQSLGVTFSDGAGGHAYARKPLFATAHSGPNVVSPSAAPPAGQVQDCAFGEPYQIQAKFSSTPKRVTVWALPLVLPDGGLGPVPNDTPYMKVFDVNNALLATVNYPVSYYLPGTNTFNPQWGTWQALTYVSSSTNIGSVQLSCTVNQGGSPVVAYFDDLLFLPF